MISIHAPREGSDCPAVRWHPRCPHYFYPRSPRGERRQPVRRGLWQPAISIHAPREGSDPAGHPETGYRGISIHAPREGSDQPTFTGLCENLISIHAPREGSDFFPMPGLLLICTFLSTLPARGATRSVRPTVPSRFHFYPRSPRGERPATSRACAGCGAISIHAPREGSDLTCNGEFQETMYFYPRSPRGERQKSLQPGSKTEIHFYPRSPRGERQVAPFKK